MNTAPNSFIEVSPCCFIANEYVELFKSLNLNCVSDFVNFEDGEKLVKANLADYRKRMRFTDTQTGKTFYLKVYNKPPLGKQVSNWIDHRKIKTLAEFDMGPIADMAECGINIPQVAAYGYTKCGLKEINSFVVTSQIPGEALERKLPECVANPENIEDILAKKEFISQLADFAKRFHKTGMRHRDFYLSHIFWDEKEGFYLIDLFRVFKPILSERFLVKDLAQLHYSSPGSIFSNSDRIRFYMNYTGLKKLTPKHKRQIAAICRKTDKMARHDKKRGRAVPFEN